MRRLTLAVLILSAACGRGGPNVAAGAGDTAFAASVPAGWRADRAAADERVAAFYGPGGQAIIVYRYAAPETPDSYIADRLADSALPRPPLPPGTRELVIEEERRSPHAPPARLIRRCVVREAKDGFFALEGLNSGPAFDAFVTSFRVP